MKLIDIIKNYAEQSEADFAILINGSRAAGKLIF